MVTSVIDEAKLTSYLTEYYYNSFSADLKNPFN